MDAQKKKHTPARRPIDGRILALENEQAMLEYLHRFGWLPTRHLASLIWLKSSTRVAQRTLLRLSKAGHVVSTMAPDGAVLYAITPAGAERLLALDGIRADARAEPFGNLDHYYYHRDIANSVCIWWQNAKSPTYAGYNTEHEIAAGRAVINKVEGHFGGDISGKTPDALLLINPPEGKEADGVKYVMWVEAENSRKCGPKLRHMAIELCHLVAAYGKPYRTFDEKYVVKMAMVACPFRDNEVRFVNALREVLAEKKALYNELAVKKNIAIWRPDGTLLSINEWEAEEKALAA